MAGLRVEWGRVGQSAAVKGVVNLAQLGLARVPLVERGLQCAGNVGHGAVVGQFAVDHDQRAVAAALFEGGKFHGRLLSCKAAIVHPAGVLRGFLGDRPFVEHVPL